MRDETNFHGTCLEDVASADDEILSNLVQHSHDAGPVWYLSTTNRAVKPSREDKSRDEALFTRCQCAGEPQLGHEATCLIGSFVRNLGRWLIGVDVILTQNGFLDRGSSSSFPLPRRQHLGFMTILTSLKFRKV